MMAIGLLFALLASCVPRAVFSHSWPVVSCSDGLRRKSSAADVTPQYTFMEFCHDACALFTTYTGQDRVSVPVSKQFSVNQGIFTCIFLDYP